MRTDSEMLTWLIREGNYSLVDHDSYLEYGEDLQTVVRAKIESAMDKPIVDLFPMTWDGGRKAMIFLKIIEQDEAYLYWQHLRCTMTNIANSWLQRLVKYYIPKENMKNPEIKQFEMTVEGCSQATEYLKKLGKYDDFMNCTFSTDGYTLVATANYLLEANYRREQQLKVTNEKN
jgi:hypothetical protein